MPATQKNRAIAITTSLGADALLLKNFTLNEQLGRLFQIDVAVASEDPDVDFDALIGSNASIRLALPSGETRFFNGIISRFVLEGNDGTYATYRTTLVPWFWLLTRTADCRIFQNKKVPDIVEEVFKGHGFKDFKLKLTASYRTWEYCVQYRETDFNFVSRLLEQEGIYYYFEHSNGVHLMVLVDSPGGHDEFPGYGTLTYRPRTQEQDENSETVTDWVLERGLQTGLWAMGDFDFKVPGSPIRVNANISRSHPNAEFEMYDYPGEYSNRAEGDAYAKVRIEEVQSQHEVLKGQSTVRGLATGSKFTLKGHFRNDQNRGYLATSTVLQAATGTYDSGNQAGSDFFSCGFSAIPSATAFRAARSTPKPLIQGPQTAIVVGKAGEEIEPDEYGRVKVQFHWDRYGKADENSSCWIRVAQASAGKAWGAIYIPRIGQEVIVEFLEGDPDRPIITGRVYNATNKVPYPLPDNKTISTTKSNSSKGGGGFNEIRFEDKKGEEQIFVHGEKNLDIRIKNDVCETIEHDRHLIIKNDQIEHITNNREETVEADHKEKIGKDRHLKIAGKEAKAVDGSQSLTVAGDVIEVFKAEHSEQTTGNYFLKAANIVIEATTNITIKVGSSSIAIESSGITMSATKIEVAGTATAEMKSPATTVKADGALTLQGAVVKIN